MRVVIVSEDGEEQELLRGIFWHVRVEAVVVANGDAALVALGSGADVLLVPLGLGTAEVSSLVDITRRRFPHVWVVFTSREPAALGAALGADEKLLTPYTVDGLRRVLHHVH